MSYYSYNPMTGSIPANDDAEAWKTDEQKEKEAKELRDFLSDKEKVNSLNNFLKSLKIR